jgi:predicted ATPase
MHIKSLHLKNFKRFTDIILQDIPQNAKLVLLIGSNGSGKSSVFDGLDRLANQNGKPWKDSQLEFRKDRANPMYIQIETYEYGIEGIMGSIFRSNKLNLSSFYGRTSFRQIPRLRRGQLGGGTDISKDNDRAESFIDREERFENDLEHLFGKLLKEFFRTDNDKSQIKKDVIDPINEALSRIFGTQNGTRLELIEMIPPLEGKTAEINFKKGDATFHYNYLSAGEKEVFNILINLVARREYYTNTIYFFDEIDLHLNTRLQFNFLKEITENWIPPKSQLWTASHSLGFIDYARQSDEAVIFDFDDFDFDKPKILVPEPKDNPDVYNIAVDKELLPHLFKDLKIVFVENTDRYIYGSIAVDKTIFVPENGRNGVYHKVKTGHNFGIVDRDYLSDEDIELIEGHYANLKVLRYYSIENYLYHPDNMEEYYSSGGKEFDKENYIHQLIEEKNKVKDEIIHKISLTRTTYNYFGEPRYNDKPFQNRFKNKDENFTETSKVASYLQSNDLETFYKAFPMKSYATQLTYRQNVAKTELAKTDWFKEQVKKVLR